MIFVSLFLSLLKNHLIYIWILNTNTKTIRNFSRELLHCM
nr:MAG TPA: hypothetical protein [Caudoviricetes sp.]DAU91654.1 MAG TPA: hypothetical protein [Caudoviricetes sp.]